MASITITIPDDQVDRVVNAICERFNYDQYVADGGTLSRPQFAKRRIAIWIRGLVTTWEMRAVQDGVTPPSEPDVT